MIKKSNANLVGLIAVLAAGAYLLKDSVHKSDMDCKTKLAGKITRQLQLALENITHKDPEMIRRFIANLNQQNNPESKSFPEIKRIELAFSRSESGNAFIKNISILYRSGESAKLYSATSEVSCDDFPNEIAEHLIRSGGKPLVYSLYSDAKDRGNKS